VVPTQALGSIGKEESRELERLEPKLSNMGLPSINDTKKDYINNFIQVLKSFERKYSEDLNSPGLNTLLSMIVLRDYFPNFRDVAASNPKVRTIIIADLC
jgi:hypothetical protein